jgi:hypothetical protein
VWPKANHADNNQVNCDDIVEDSRHQQDQDAREQCDERLYGHNVNRYRRTFCQGLASKGRRDMDDAERRQRVDDGVHEGCEGTTPHAKNGSAGSLSETPSSLLGGFQNVLRGLAIFLCVG